MNLYQTLNQEYREFRMKQSLKESEEVIKEYSEDIETPTEEDFKQDDKNILQTRLNEISDRLTEIDDIFDTASDDEREALNSEKESLSLEVSKIEEEINGLNDSECSTEIKEDEEVEEISEEENSIVKDIDKLANISKEEIVAELEKLTDEERDAVKNNFEAIKGLANELFPEEEVTEEITDEVIEDSEDLESTEEIESQEEITECEISNFKIVRSAPKSSAYMIEAQTKDGVKYITGKNFNEDSKVLDEAEMTDSKQEATNRFKSLLSNK